MAPLIKHLGRVDYLETFEAMRAHNRASTAATPDEIWILEHAPVFTQGLAGKPEHVLDAGDIPVVKIDRGGQVTYHGPGQLVVYLLLNMRARGYGVKELVRRIEQSVIDLLAEYGVEAVRQTGMPGVYVMLHSDPTAPSAALQVFPFPSVPPPRVGREAILLEASLPSRERGWREGPAKIAAVGLRVANHATYHGLSLNVNMDLEPFTRINPCGYEGLAVTQLADMGVRDNVAVVGGKLVEKLKVNLYDRS